MEASLEDMILLPLCWPVNQLVTGDPLQASEGLLVLNPVDSSKTQASRVVPGPALGVLSWTCPSGDELA